MSYTCEERDLVVIGAGPAGLCAALEAVSHKCDPLVLDENHRGGGQLLKQVHKFFGSHHHGAGKRGFQIGEELVEKCEEKQVEIRLNSLAAAFFQDGSILVRDPKKIYLLKSKATIIATGAVEKPLAFPGWTLPGVMGAGGAQTLMNVHRVLPGRRIAMVGSGNVGLIVAYQLVQAGASIACIIEVDDKVKGYQVHRDKLRKLGIKILLRHRVVRAEGDDCVRAVLVEDMQTGRVFRYKVDGICLAVGMSPLVELPLMRGCELEYNLRLGGWVVRHDENMRTSCPNVYVAGDVSGVEEASIAMEEGRLAGISACVDLGLIAKGKAQNKRKEILERLRELRAISGKEVGEDQRSSEERNLTV